jgi:hypothetical protein
VWGAAGALTFAVGMASIESVSGSGKRQEPSVLSSAALVPVAKPPIIEVQSEQTADQGQGRVRAVPTLSTRADGRKWHGQRSGLRRIADRLRIVPLSHVAPRPRSPGEFGR